MIMRDENFYPVEFKSFEVATADAYGNPLVTNFYKNADKTGLVFVWTQTWNSFGKCTSWSISIKG